jgi:hypothetical protein
MASPIMLHNAPLGEFLERFVHHDLDPAIFGAVKRPVANSGGHDVCDCDSLARMFPQVIPDQPSKLTALKVAWAELDPLRYDLRQFGAGPQDADRRLDMRQVGAELSRQLFSLDDQARDLRSLVAQGFAP